MKVKQENIQKMICCSSRMVDIQLQMSERALELLALPDSICYILDLGCGSGLSGHILETNGHVWVGIDISVAMLSIAGEREVEGDLILGDLGQGVPFRAGVFDAAVSVSALQWLCNADKKSHNPVKRLYKFFSSLYASLVRSALDVSQRGRKNFFYIIIFAVILFIIFSQVNDDR
uniref:Methyltransferase type 11 domain-containing protein n=1 Tax=Timema tahoe TaxID=61484 RepID=A0A7R9IRC0_9NEOP|nr:unnamed protein product [Timema tahoe]